MTIQEFAEFFVDTRDEEEIYYLYQIFDEKDKGYITKEEFKA